MKLNLTSLLPALLAPSLAATQGPPYERLDKNNSVLVIVDIQEGLFSIARDFDATLFRENILAYAEIGKVFNLPVIMTTSAQQGPNGPLPSEILDMYPTAPLIQRQGEVDAFDNPDVRKAIEATGKKQVIIAGIATDVCTTFLALSLREAGYSVWANIEASGTTTALIRDISNDRMMRAGVNVVSFFAIVGELFRDWRNTPGAPELFPFLDKHFPAYGYVARNHANAVRNGTIFPGEDTLH